MDYRKEGWCEEGGREILALLGSQALAGREPTEQNFNGTDGGDKH